MVFEYAREYAEHWADIWTVWLMTREEPMRLSHRDEILAGKGVQRQYAARRNDPRTVDSQRKRQPQRRGQLHHGPPRRCVAAGTPCQRRSFDAIPITSRVTRCSWVFRRNAHNATITRSIRNGARRTSGASMRSSHDHPRSHSGSRRRRRKEKEGNGSPAITSATIRDSTIPCGSTTSAAAA